MTELVYLAVSQNERRDVARALLAHAETPNDVQATSEGFAVPRCVFDAAFPQESNLPAPDPEPAVSRETAPDTEAEADSARDSSGRFKPKKGRT